MLEVQTTSGRGQSAAELLHFEIEQFASLRALTFLILYFSCGCSGEEGDNS